MKTTLATDAQSTDYVWAFPGSPIRIQIALAAIPRLREYMFAGVDQEPTEMGGLLLGTLRPSCIAITGFQPLSPARPGRHFILSEGDKAVISQRQAASEQLSVVGYFRSDIRDGIQLYEDDLLLIRDVFRDPTQVFLVARKQETGPPVAGFFFWDRESIFTEASFMEFPLDDHWLAMPRKPTQVSESSTWPREQQPCARNERIRKPSSFSTWRTRGAWAASALVVLAGGWALSGRFRSLESPPTPAASAVVAPLVTLPGQMPLRSPFSLSATHGDKSLAIKWDAHAVASFGARIGVLTIIDGESRREIPLSSTQLKTGSINYSPRTNRLQMTLEVFASTGAPAQDAVTVLVARAGTVNLGDAADATTHIQEKEESPVSPANTSPANPSKPAGESFNARATPAAPAPAFPQVPTGDDGTTLKMLDLPVVTTAGPPLPIPQAGVGQVRLQLPPPSERATAAPMLPVRPPKVIRQVKPDIPANVSAMLKRQVHVQIRVFLDTTGKVVRAEPVGVLAGVSAYLGQTARNAVRHWTFQPGRQGETDVPSELVVQFAFGPER